MGRRNKEGPGCAVVGVLLFPLAIGCVGLWEQLKKDFPQAFSHDVAPSIVDTSPQELASFPEDLSRFPPGVLRWESLLRDVASAQGVSVVDLATLMTIESRGDMTVPGGSGEQCAMQIMFEYHGGRIPDPYPKTPESLHIPEVCVWVAGDILRDFQDAYPHNPLAWYAGYNGGPMAASWFNGEVTREHYIQYINSFGRDGLQKADYVQNYVDQARYWLGWP